MLTGANNFRLYNDDVFTKNRTRSAKGLFKQVKILEVLLALFNK